MKVRRFCCLLLIFYPLLLSPFAGGETFNSTAVQQASCEKISVADFSDFLQVTPTPNAVPTRRTEIKITQDGVTLFVEIRAFDSNPNTIIARQMRRDQYAMLAEDQVTLVFDAQGNHRDGWVFAVNPAGTQFDALIYDGSYLRSDWDAVWQSTAQIEDFGWSATLEIPLAIFGQNNNEHWNFNAERWIASGNERVRLTSHRPEQTIYSLGAATSLPIAKSSCASQTLNAKISLRATRENSIIFDSQQNAIEHTDEYIEPGLEIFHESRSGLRTAVALNIDFGEAETDERQINLGRFELFQDEKRAFFLHDAGRFSFGGLDESAVMPYYSRRIGLDSNGQPQELTAGLKLTAQTEALDFGILTTRVATATNKLSGEELGEEPGKATDDTAVKHPDHANVAVVRLAKPMGSRHQLGVVGTLGNPEGTSGSHLWGLDHQFRNTSWMGNKTLETQAWIMGSRNQDLAANAWGAALHYPNLGLTGGASVQYIEAGFNPALGYLAEDNVLTVDGETGWWQRTETGNNITPGMDWSFRRTLDGKERTVTLNPEWVYESAAGDVLVLEGFYIQDELTEAYAPLPNTWINAGRYDWHRANIVVETSSARQLTLEAGLEAGEYYDGHSNDQFVLLRWQPNSHWGVEGSFSRHDINLPAGRDIARVAGLRFDLTPSTQYTQSFLLQWDNLSEETGISLRARWLWGTGKELFFALERIRDTSIRRKTEPEESVATLKLVWSL